MLFHRNILSFCCCRSFRFQLLLRLLLIVSIVEQCTLDVNFVHESEGNALSCIHVIKAKLVFITHEAFELAQSGLLGDAIGSTEEPGRLIEKWNVFDVQRGLLCTRDLLCSFIDALDYLRLERLW